jgi:hypothetical protein
LAFVGTGLLFTSCNKEEPKAGEEPDQNDPGTEKTVFVSTEQQTRGVLIEELTGWGCQYCPAGHKLCDQLADKYPGKFYSINVHCGNYSEGRNPEYTTDEGYTLLRTLGIAQYFGFPSGYINRRQFSVNVNVQGQTKTTTGYGMDRGLFEQISSKLMAENAEANIAAKSVLDKSTRELKVTVQVCFTQAPKEGVLNSHILNVALVQNNIKGPQSGAATHYPEHWDGTSYIHNHMLRTLITGLRGDIFEYEGTGKDHVFEKTYTYKIPENMGRGNIPAVLEDMEVICFVTNKATNTSNPEDYFPLPILNVCKSEMSYK